MEKTYCVKVAYDGSMFFGWAKQNNNSIRTVQGCIENLLSEITKEKISIYASGRTDKYVHAIDQCFHFKTKYDLDKKILFKQMLINQPEDISFKSIRLSRGLASLDCCYKQWRHVAVVGWRLSLCILIQI